MVPASADPDRTLSPESADPDGGDGRRSSRRSLQAWLSAFFIIHWMSVAAYVLPATKEAMEPLPDWLEPLASAVIPRAVRWTSPVTAPYLDLTGVRQHWTLFAPRPAEWAPSIRVVPYFASADSGWVRDTLTLRGPREQGRPHVLHHRTHRVLFNLGYESWGRSYRGHFAAGLCRTLVDLQGRGPQGLELVAEWYPIGLPWAPGEVPSNYRQRLGGFDCSPEQVGAAAPWAAYGLPEAVDTRGWTTVFSRPGTDPASDGEVSP